MAANLLPRLAREVILCRVAAFGDVVVGGRGRAFEVEPVCNRSTFGAKASMFSELNSPRRRDYYAHPRSL